MAKSFSKNSYRQELNSIVEALKAYKPEKIILFGSMLDRDEPSNDIDLFLIKKSRKRRIDRAREARGFIRGCKAPIDLIVYTPEEVKESLEIGSFFIEDIIKEGKILYEAQK